MVSFSDPQTANATGDPVDQTHQPVALSVLRQRALGWLARREYSQWELQRRLVQIGATAAQADALLTDLLARGWLSDARFAEARVNARQSRNGVQRIARELRALGVDDETITHATVELQATEVERAFALWCKKFKQKAVEPREKAKQYRFLQARGFSHAVIRQVLESDTVERD